MKKLILIFVSLCLSVGWIAAQEREISGIVISGADDTPIIGASVIVQGVTPLLGTQTDIDGKFTLKVPFSAKMLTVSYVGMRTMEVEIQPTLRIVMQTDAKVLEEVVVTAMGLTRQKKSLGYAVQDVKAENLVQAANSNLSTALQGKVSGIEITPSSGMPGASAKLTIRGSRSFTGDNTPLYVIDGMPVASAADVSTLNSVTGSDFANRSVDIDPNDIESINVLKGQAASALYGMRASNGVIVITTKSGKGAKGGKPEITLNTSLSFDVLSAMPKLQKEYAQGKGGVYSPNASTSWGPKISELPNDPKYGGNTDNAYTAKDGKKPGMYYVPQRAIAGLDPWTKPQSYNNIILVSDKLRY